MMLRLFLLFLLLGNDFYSFETYVVIIYSTCFYPSHDPCYFCMCSCVLVILYCPLSSVMVCDCIVNFAVPLVSSSPQVVVAYYWPARSVGRARDFNLSIVDLSPTLGTKM